MDGHLHVAHEHLSLHGSLFGGPESATPMDHQWGAPQQERSWVIVHAAPGHDPPWATNRIIIFKSPRGSLIGGSCAGSSVCHNRGLQSRGLHESTPPNVPYTHSASSKRGGSCIKPVPCCKVQDPTRAPMRKRAADETQKHDNNTTMRLFSF